MQNFNYANPYTLITTLKTLSASIIPLGNIINFSKFKPRELKIIGVVSYDSSVELIKEMIPLVDELCIVKSGKWWMI